MRQDQFGHRIGCEWAGSRSAAIVVNSHQGKSAEIGRKQNRTGRNGEDTKVRAVQVLWHFRFPPFARSRGVI